MERDPGTEEDSGDTAGRNADPGSTGIDVVALIHQDENEAVLKIRSVRE